MIEATFSFSPQDFLDTSKNLDEDIQRDIFPPPGTGSYAIGGTSKMTDDSAAEVGG